MQGVVPVVSFWLVFMEGLVRATESGEVCPLTIYHPKTNYHQSASDNHGTNLDAECDISVSKFFGFKTFPFFKGIGFCIENKWYRKKYLIRYNTKWYKKALYSVTNNFWYSEKFRILSFLVHQRHLRPGNCMSKSATNRID